MQDGYYSLCRFRKLKFRRLFSGVTQPEQHATDGTIDTDQELSGTKFREAVFNLPSLSMAGCQPGSRISGLLLKY